MMLASTRLIFAAATLAFSENRAVPSPNDVPGEADRQVQK